MTAVTDQPGTVTPDDPGFGRFGLMGLRVAWTIVAAIVIAFYAVGIPLRLRDLQTIHTPIPGRTLQDLQLTAERAEALANTGISLQLYSFVVVGSALLMAMPWLLIALLIVYWKPGDWRVLVFSLAMLCFSTAEAEIANVVIWYVPQLEWLYRSIQSIGTVLSLVVFFLLPNFVFVPAKTRYLAIIYTLIVAVWLLVPPFPLNIIHADFGDSYQPWTTLHVIAWHSTGIVALVLRYKQAEEPAQQRLMRVLVISCTIAFSVAITRYALQWVVTTIDDPLVQSIGFVVTRQVYWGSLIAIPAGFFVAIYRHRLWGIETYINRALVYLLLTGALSLIFGILVGGAGLLLQRNLGALASPLTIIAFTGLFVVVAQPIRDVIQRAVNRQMYGRRDEPYAVVAAMGARLANTLDSDSILPSIVYTIGQALKLPYVAIIIQQAGAEHTIAEFRHELNGTSARSWNGILKAPITYQSNILGTLIVSPRSPKDSLSPQDRSLLEDLARQAGPVVHAFLLLNDLRRSREMLVITRENERRYVRRQLHDGLVPALAGHVLKLDTAEALIAGNTAAAQAMMHELKQETRTLMTGVRELAYELRPPALDELGLIAALQVGTDNLVTTLNSTERAFQKSLNETCVVPTISFDVPKPLPVLSAAVEAAAYRITMEAISNVIRHARACSSSVHLSVELKTPDQRFLLARIEDDGIGLSVEVRQGVGMQAMRERAEEIGGTLVVEKADGKGTRVIARLPLT